ncbi:MAG: hypothetical protein L6Q54_10095 [Leptospiraceae bacterium]|nr:hypothetical protein [Leptospiraceae bacterium]MCK6381578.1 hypothetical protein [Leptospiraceae bacterium]NUM40722.1 hypothetical protein [Leptospiraceae bacterium]
MSYLKWISIAFFLFGPTWSISSRDAMSFYEEAYKIEKISPLLSIPLYEKAISVNTNKQVLKTCVSRLRYFYLKFGKNEEAILLRQKFGSEFVGNKNIESLIESISNEIGVSPSYLSSIAYLSSKSDEKPVHRLTEILNSNPNNKLFRFIFSLKMTLRDYSSLKKLFELNPSSEPFLKLAFLVKSEAEEADSLLDELGADEPLSLKRKSDLLYLKGMRLRSKKQMKLSARFFLMSSSYSRKDRGILEAARTLIAAGKKSEGCGLIKPSLKIENESDEILLYYCSEKSRNKLKQVRSSIQVLSEKENNLFFKRVLNEIR